MSDTRASRPSKYREAFRTTDDVEAYARLYGPDTRSEAIWDQELPVLRSMIEDLTPRCRRLDLLDFACGYGRVAEAVADICHHVDAADISSSMISRAMEMTISGSRVRYLNAASEDLVSDGSTYDVATLFRFVLNAEPCVRTTVLADLHRMLEPRGGHLIVHNHGNSWSLRTPALWLHRRPDFRNVLSHARLCDELTVAGFEVLDRVGFGLLPEGLHRGRSASVASRIDPGSPRRGTAASVCIESIVLARAAAAGVTVP